MKNRILKLTFIGVAFLMLAVGARAGASKYDFGEFDGKALDASAVNVLSNSKEFIGKKIRVIGVYFHDFESSRLFLSREALEAWDVPSAIQLPVAGKLLPAPVDQLEKLNGCLVAIEGVVYREANRIGLKDVTRVFLKGRGPANEVNK